MELVKRICRHFSLSNLHSELSWTYYRLLMKVENKKARQFYLDECVKFAWSTRQLERQINSFFYEQHLLPNGEKMIVTGQGT
ncbi:MAG: DUF1016 N-terminal domain-containing protein [Candidatus Fimivicinus sp.]|nr:DUF1016 N-terminal domain-containing protein [Candidatus Fimivicinus sp.]